MTLFGRLAAFFGERKTSVLQEIPAFLRYPESKTGHVVSTREALQVTTVLACARLIAEGIAQVPLRMYQGDAAGRRRRVFDHPLLRVLGRKPNPWQTEVEFRETILLHLVLTGNAFVFVNRVRGEVYELIPIEPGWVTIERTGWPDQTLRYRIAATDGSAERSVSGPLGADVIWHLRGPSWNSWVGLDAVKTAREAIGLALATEEAHAKMHRNGARPSGVLSTPTTLSDEAYAKLVSWIDEAATGKNASRPLIVDRGMSYTQAGMTGVDAQHVETRRFQVEEICRALRVIPMMIGHADKTATYASAEQMFIAHVVHTLMPWARRFEASAEKCLLGEAETKIDIKLHLAGLMRGAASDRATYFSKALGAGGSPAWMTQNDVRAEDDLDWIEGYDDLPVTTNAPATPAGAAGAP